MSFKAEFHTRDCWHLAVDSRLALSVENHYGNGFDARIGNNIVYFTDTKARMNPLSVLVPTALLQKLEANDRFFFSNDCIEFVGLCRLERGNSIESPNFNGEIDQKKITENLNRLFGNIKLFGRPSLAKSIIIGRRTKDNVLSDIERALFCDSPDIEGITGLIGRGEGLTPSFDDFLCGMIFADRFYKLNRISLPGQLFREFLHRTTTQSWQQLGFVAGGRLSIGYERFLASMATETVKSADILSLLNHGHSSGTDILSGIWFYSRKQVII
ncbi:MAG: hypothetical protein Kow0029_30010 [Candidatus Rifleibacteriota bacterium]